MGSELQSWIDEFGKSIRRIDQLLRIHQSCILQLEEQVRIHQSRIGELEKQIEQYSTVRYIDQSPK